MHRKARRLRSFGASPATGHSQVIRSLTRGGVALLANSALTALFGVVFWLVAARILPATTVGRGSALVSALVTVSALSQLNYARSLSRLIPLADRPRKLLASVYGITVAISLAVGLGSAYLLPQFSAEFSYLRGDLLLIACFTVSVGIWSIFNLEDAALTSVRRATIMPYENGAYGVLKLICLVALWGIGFRGSIVIFVSWILPLVVVVVPVNLYLFLRAVPASGLPVVARESRSQTWLRYDFAGYLLWLAGTLPLPVLVLTIAGPAKSAVFYVAFTIAQAIDILSLNLGNTLTAELSRTRGVLMAATKSYLVRVWVAVGILGTLFFIMAPEILQVFGDKYRIGGTIILRTFMIAAVPRSVLFMGIAIQRSRGKGPSILLLQSISSLGTLGLGLALTHSLGPTGTSLAWTAASCLAALVTVFMLRGRPTPGESRTESHRGLPGVTGLPGTVAPAGMVAPASTPMARERTQGSARTAANAVIAKLTTARLGMARAPRGSWASRTWSSNGHDPSGLEADPPPYRPWGRGFPD